MESVISLIFITLLAVAYSEEFDSTHLNKMNGKMPGVYIPDVKYIIATVSLMDKHDIHFCLGTVFHRQRILTTATCVHHKESEENFGGMYILAEANFNPEYSIRRDVQKINCSSHYVNEEARLRLRFDIAIVTLTELLPTSIVPIPLSSSHGLENTPYAKAIIFKEDCSLSSCNFRVARFRTHMYAVQSDDEPREEANDFLGLCESWGDMDKTIDCISTLTIGIIAIYPIINSFLNNRKLKALLETIESDWNTWSSTPELEILKYYAERGSSYRFKYAAISNASLAAYIILSFTPEILDVLAPLNESRHKISLYVVKYYFDQDKYFYWTAFYESGSTILTISFLLAGDLPLMACIQHACAVLAAIGYRLQNIMPLENYESECKNDLEEINKNISFCVTQHIKIMKFVKDVNEFYSSAYFLTVVMYLIILSMIGMQVINNMDQLDMAIKYTVSNIGLMFRVFCISLACQQLMNLSTGISNCVYDGNWYQLPVRSRKLLLMIMRKSSYPCSFTVGKLYTYSMESYITLIRTAMSYLTVLHSIQ